MKYALTACLIVLASCESKEAKEQIRTVAQDESMIRDMIASLNAQLAKACNGANIDTDSLMDAYYETNIYYITPWGWSEPLDTTKARLQKAIPRIKDFENRIEKLEVKVYGDGAYASFILRQNYTVDGALLEEYLPTTLIFERRGEGWKIVHAHRSTDYETFQQYIALQLKQEALR
ncbi:MAG: nuclear transport factor 2 family protein [Ignavibacteria bacterium]|nr:nuclear transport factor 2 family protein [Ignavibacteria bacterium]